MRLSVALRIACIIIVAKAVLIGVVYWRRAEILGRPLHIGADHHHRYRTCHGSARLRRRTALQSGNLTLPPPPATRSPSGGPNRP